jgi:hypothetical protein
VRSEALEYVIIAVGGTGAKVAEAFVDLMTVGAPLSRHEGQARAALNGGDRFTIVRVDTDKECRSSQLDDAIQRYEALQSHAPKDSGLWGPSIRNAGILHPLDALGGRENDQSLESYLATQDPDKSGVKLLESFYSPADLATPLHQGFFQCPDIGAAIVGSIADLEKTDPPSPLIQMMGKFRARDVRVFVVGSLFGGTGAAGVPALARALKTLAKRWKVEDKWRIGACLLGPYFLPPDPPIGSIDWGQEWQPGGSESLDDFLVRRGVSESEYLDRVIENQSQKGDTLWEKETIRQIARGYYAKRSEIVDRAFDSWIHYEKHGRHLFDRLYLLGLSNPTDYGREKHNGRPIAWANGGRNQESPLHVVELAAATAAQHFFSTEEVGKEVFLLGVQPGSVQQGDSLAWDDLGSSRGLDFGQSMTAALVGYNWLKFTWERQLLTFRDLEKATALSALNDDLDEESFSLFRDTLMVAEKAIGKALLDLRMALAWDTDCTSAMQHWCEDPVAFGETGVLRKRAKSYEFPGGRSLTASQQELGRVGTQDGEHARDEMGQAAVQYLRGIWGELESRIEITQHVDA